MMDNGSESEDEEQGYDTGQYLGRSAQHLETQELVHSPRSSHMRPVTSNTTLTAYYDDRCTWRRAIVGVAVMASLACIFIGVILTRGLFGGEEEGGSGHKHGSTVVPTAITTCMVTTVVSTYVAEPTHSASVSLPTYTSTYTLTVNPTAMDVPSALAMPIATRTARIIKSEKDRRLYRWLALSNGLRVMLVSDPEATTAGGAMSVRCGSADDPVTLPGLAHLTEHMLFLGSSKYPTKSYFDDYIMAHGGNQANAYTSEENTVYYFNVGSSFLNQSLDIFRGFFVDPLMSPEAIADESQAVNSEHEKNQVSNAWKLYALLATRAKPEHPTSRFHTGNVETLMYAETTVGRLCTGDNREIPKQNNIDVATAMKNYYDRCYRASNMFLAVVAPVDLDSLEDMVAPMFVDVPSGREVDRSEPLGYPYADDVLGSYIIAKPVGETRQLVITWQLPSTRGHPDKPTLYILHALGDEGAGSLLAHLKKRGLATGLMAGDAGYYDYTIVSVEISLTPAGLKAWKDVLLALFQYLDMMRSAGPQKYLFDEMIEQQRCSWRYPSYNSPRDAAKAFAAQMALQDRPPEAILGPPDYPLWDEVLISNTLDLLTPDSMLALIYDPSPDARFTETEKWQVYYLVYQTPYTPQKFTTKELSALTKARNMDGYFALPRRNPFQCKAETLELLPTYVEAQLLQHDMDQGVTLWFAKDNTFKVPVTDMIFALVAPETKTITINGNSYTAMDPMVSELLVLFIAILEELTIDLRYMAVKASFDVAMNAGLRRIKLRLHGYSDQMKVILDQLLPAIRTAKDNPQFSQAFDMVKERRLQDLRNVAFDKAFSQGKAGLEELIIEKRHTVNESLAALEQVNANMVMALSDQFLSDVHVEMLVFGNAMRQDAHDYLLTIRSAFSTRKRSPNQKVHPVGRVADLHDEKKYPTDLVYVIPNTNKDDKVGAAVAYMQAGRDTVQQRSLTQLVQVVAAMNAFTTLRTEEMLGYVVSMYAQVMGHFVGVIVTVQSTRHPAYVQSRITSFLRDRQAKAFQKMSEEEFETQKQSLIEQLSRGHEALSGQTTALWNEITYTADVTPPLFDRLRQQIDFLKTLKKKDLVTFYNGLIKRLLSVQILPEAVTDWGEDKDARYPGQYITKEEFREKAAFEE